VEIRAGVHRHIQRKYAWTKMCPSLREDFVEIRVLFVHRVDHDDFWDSALIGEIRNAFCADPDAVLRMNNHQREIGYVQRRERLAHEVEVAWRVHDVEFFVHPGGMQKRRLGGNLSLLFAHVIIGDGGAVRDPSHAVDRAAACQHRFAQDCFSGRGMPDDGKVADLRTTMVGHDLQDEPELDCMQARRDKTFTVWRSIDPVATTTRLGELLSETEAFVSRTHEQSGGCYF
jgi:hypothetical protein